MEASQTMQKQSEKQAQGEWEGKINAWLFFSLEDYGFTYSQILVGI